MTASGVPADDADATRARMRESWERVAPMWGRQAERVRDMGLAVSMWLIDHLHLQPGQRVLELAAGPGDTGFLAAELIAPGGTLICSDGAEAMVEVARARAAQLGVAGVEFKVLELEWIDLPAAGVDAIVCRWGLMFALDPGAALRECRRVLRPGGRLALAVWDEPEANPWATIPRRALTEAGHLAPEDPSQPGMFSLAAPGRLAGLIEDAGFSDVRVEGVELPRQYPDAEAFLAETLELSSVVATTWQGLDEGERAAVRARIAELSAPFARGGDGRLVLPGRSLGAAAEA